MGSGGAGKVMGKTTHRLRSTVALVSLSRLAGL